METMPTPYLGRRSHWTPKEGEKRVLSQVKAVGGSQPVWTTGPLCPPHLAPQAPHRTAVERGSFNSLWSLPVISHMGWSFSLTSLFHRNLQLVKDIKCIHSVQTHWTGFILSAGNWDSGPRLPAQDNISLWKTWVGLVPRALRPSTMAAPGASAPTGGPPINLCAQSPGSRCLALNNKAA